MSATPIESVELLDELRFLLNPPAKPFSGVEYSPDEAEVWIMGIPYDSTSTFKPGSRFAPARIREVGWELESYSPSRGVDIEELPISDIGDLPLSVEYPPFASRVKRVVELALKHGKTLMILGGEHLITLPVIDVLSKSNSSLMLVVFDAHLDLRDQYPLGSRYTHATVMRRISETGVNILYYKPRAFSKEEYEYLRKSPRLKITSGEELEELEGPVYISIDMDAIDPAYAPGVGNPEPLGIAPHEVVDALRSIASSNADIVGLDIVETNPLVDVNDITSLTAAKLLLEVLFLYTP